jgi:hypothetical protein
MTGRVSLPVRCAICRRRSLSGWGSGGSECQTMLRPMTGSVTDLRDALLAPGFASLWSVAPSAPRVPVRVATTATFP